MTGQCSLYFGHLAASFLETQAQLRVLPLFAVKELTSLQETGDTVGAGVGGTGAKVGVLSMVQVGTSQASQRVSLSVV